MATVLSTRVICRQPGRYIGWPTIAKAPNGDLLAVFSGDRFAHVSPDGKIQMVRSTDNGATWSEPVTIADTPIDDRDVGIVRTAKGTMLIGWFTQADAKTTPQELRDRWLGHWVRRSTDNGHTWGDLIRTSCSTPHGPIQLRDGRLLVVGQFPHCSQEVPFTLSVEESRDDGLTWKVISRFDVPEGAHMLSYDEPYCAETDDGRIVMLFRDCFNEHRIHQSESEDGGLTWSKPHTLELAGFPPHLLRLRNGWLVVVYGKRWESFGEYACVSRDGGRTWDVENEILLSAAPDGDLGYPASVQLDGGSICTVYYQTTRSGETPCLMATHWRLDGMDE